MLFKLTWYLVVGLLMIFGPNLHHSISDMTSTMRKQALTKASEPWPQLCQDWSYSTRMPENERKMWRKKYLECRARNSSRYKQ